MVKYPESIDIDESLHFNSGSAYLVDYWGSGYPKLGGRIELPVEPLILSERKCNRCGIHLVVNFDKIAEPIFAINCPACGSGDLEIVR